MWNRCLSYMQPSWQSPFCTSTHSERHLAPGSPYHCVLLSQKPHSPTGTPETMPKRHLICQTHEFPSRWVHKEQLSHFSVLCIWFICVFVFGSLLDWVTWEWRMCLLIHKCLYSLWCLAQCRLSENKFNTIFQGGNLDSELWNKVEKNISCWTYMKFYPLYFTVWNSIHFYFIIRLIFK